MIPFRIDLSGSGVIDVREFGAVGDKTADDTQAFQDAIDYFYDADAALNRGVVYVPPGSYLIDETVAVQMMDNVVIRGAGYGSSELICKGTSAGAIIKRPFNGGGGNARDQFQEVSGLRFVLRGANQTGIDASYCDRIRIHGNQFTIQDRVQEWSNSPTSPASGVTGIRLNTSALPGCGGQNAIIRDNKMYWLDKGIAVDGGHAHLIDGNDITSVNEPITVASGVTGARITSNLIQFWASGQRGIDTYGTDGVIFANYLENDISGASEAILLRSGSTRNKVRDNPTFLYSPASTTKVVDSGTANTVVL
jgi:hypothetical protein